VHERDIVEDFAIFVIASRDLPSQREALAVARLRHHDFSFDDLRQINCNRQQLENASFVLRWIKEGFIR
jgi:hypothetical protein